MHDVTLTPSSNPVLMPSGRPFVSTATKLRGILSVSAKVKQKEQEQIPHHTQIESSEVWPSESNILLSVGKDVVRKLVREKYVDLAVYLSK